MNWINLSSLIFIISTVTIEQIQCSGLFELKVKSFKNDKGKDNIGACCSGVSDASGKCIGTCKTRFRVCLKHYQAKIDLKSPCTFGDVITPVLGDNTFNMSLADQPTIKGFVNSIRFPFDFAWPGTFTLILEAWHETNSTTSRSPGILISRLSIQRVLDVSQEWTEDKHDSAHSAIEYQFRVTCDSHYYGSGCANLCRPRDDSFGHYTCSSSGDRVCLTGWDGDYCSKPRCLSGCDEQHGHCSKPNECICQPGWKGARCDECEPYPGCVHGTCRKPWECICNEGWGGLFCNQDLNFCTNHKPCQNNGTCFNTGQGSYTCNCTPGFTGVDCEVQISDCAVNPCLSGGTCHEDLRNHRYKCECQKNWIGKHCEKETMTCADKPCVHGKCTDDSEVGFRCVCPFGYSGATCDAQVDECSPSPCVNGGTCVNSKNDYQCFCPSGFVGSRCEENVDDCQGNPCLNGGSCLDLINQFRCQCVPGFIGSLCENKVDLCLTKPCANGGTCTNLNNDYRCSCRPGFTGKDCSIDVDECAPVPCKNGGTCVNRVNSFQCICAGGFRGVMCEEEAYSAAWNLAGSSSSSSRHIAATDRHKIIHDKDEGLSNGQIVLIAILSIAVPVIAIVAACIVICMKKQRRREQEKDDAEARKQNEQNASHISHLHHSSMSSKRSSNSTLGMDSSHHMIKNTWDKSVNHVSNSVSMDECLMNTSSMYAGGGGIGSGGALSNYNDNSAAPTLSDCYQSSQVILPQTIQRVKSQKQLNTDPMLSQQHQQHRSSQILSSSTATTPTKDLLLEKRISILSDATLCNTRWGGGGHRQIVVGGSGPCSPPHI